MRRVLARRLRIGLCALHFLAVACVGAAFAADEPDTLAADVALYRIGREAPPHRLLGVVYMHRWSLPGHSVPDWQALYRVVAKMARKYGADMVVGAVTGEDDPLIENGQVKWFLGLAARSTVGAGGSIGECDNCVVDWGATDSSSAGAGDGELLARVGRKVFAISRLRLAEAGYYLRDRRTAGHARPDTAGASNLRLEVSVNRGSSADAAAPENLSFTSRLIWNVSDAEAWKRIVSVTTPSSRFEEGARATRNALVDLYSSLPQRGPTPDTDGDGVPDSRDKEPGTREGAEVDFCGTSRDDDGDGVPNGIDRDPFTPRDAGPVDQWGSPVDADGDEVADYVDNCPDTPAGVLVDKDGCTKEEWVTVLEDALVDQGLLRVRFPFELGSARLNADSEARLDTIGVTLSGLQGLRFSVEGHCDDQGSDALNDTLSAMRARSVTAYLVKKFRGLTRQQFTARGWGKRKPMAEGTDETSRALNRRVEFVVENPEDAKRIVTIKRAMQRGEIPGGSPASPEPGRRD